MAAAVTSGVVAAMIDAHRQAVTWTSRPMTPNTVKAILQYSAIELRIPDRNDYNRSTQGAGEINADGAIDLAQLVDPSRPLGTTWINSQPWPYWCSTASTRRGHSTWCGATISCGEFALLSRARLGRVVVLGRAGQSPGLGQPRSVRPCVERTPGLGITSSGNALVAAIDAEHIVWGNLDPNASVLGNADLNLANSLLGW